MVKERAPRGTQILALAKRKPELLEKLKAGMSVQNAAKAIGISTSVIYRNPEVLKEVNEARGMDGATVATAKRSVKEVEGPSYDLIPYSRGMYLLILRDGKRTLSFLGTPVRLTPDMEVSRNGR